MSGWLDAIDLRQLAPRLGVHVDKGGMARCIDPAHDDAKPSMQVFKDGAKCHARGDYWGAIDFVAQAGGMSRDDAKAWLKKESGVGDKPQKKTKGPWVVSTLDNLRAKKTGTQEHHSLTLVQTWDYLAPDGSVLCGVARYTDPSGRKEYRPYVPQNGGFRIGRPPNPVPLYNLPKIATAAGVIVVEGEKVAERLQRLLDTERPEIAAAAWMGGAQYARGADWSALDGKAVYVWPDNDQAGRDAAMTVARRIQPVARYVRVVVPDPTWADKSDLYDLIEEGWDWDRIYRWLTESSIEARPIEEDAPTDRADRLADNEHFRILGVSESAREHTIVVYRRATGIVRHFTPGSKSQMQLRILAPDGFWSALFPVEEQRFMYSPRHLMTIYGAMSDIADRKGLWDPSRMRGRGWHWVKRKGKRVPVLNTGAELVSEGVSVPIADRNGPDVWVAKKAIPWGDPSLKADPEIRKRLWSMMECQLWSNPAQAYAVAGWATLAPICGLLDFRPGLWVRGQAGMGKSFLVSHLQELLGDTLQLIQGESSEPGIRRALKHDTIATLIDEYEAADRNKRANVAAILALMRMCSGRKGGVILKADMATPDGVTSTPLRTMMMFSSIAHTRTEEANESRIMHVSIEPSEGMDDAALNTHMVQVIQPAVRFISEADNVSEVFLHWVLAHVEDLLECVKIGKTALLRSGHRIRFSELHGTLLAAGLFVKTGEMPDPDEVLDLSGRLSVVEKAEPARDDVRLIERILDHRVRLEARLDDEPSVRRITLAALVHIATGRHIDGISMSVANARTHLGMNGILTGEKTRANGVDTDCDSLILSCKHPTPRDALEGTRWEDTDYGEIIARGIGERYDGRPYFGDRRSKAVRVAIADIPMLRDDGAEPAPDDPLGDDNDIPF